MQINIKNGTITQIQEAFSPASGYSVPQSVTISGASQLYNSSTGLLTLSNLDSNIYIYASGIIPTTKNIWIDSNKIIRAYLNYSKISKMYLGPSLIYEKTASTVLFNITTNITNGTYSGDTYIEVGDTSANVILSADNNYILPILINVTGANYTYNSITGVITLTNFTGNVTITAACQQEVALDSYLTFSSDDEFTIKVYSNTKTWDGILYYSPDLRNWNEWNGEQISSTNDGNKEYIYFRGIGNTCITGGDSYTSGSFTYDERWVLTGTNISCVGNIENILDFQEVVCDNHPPMANYCFAHLFYYCSSLITPPSLPATTLAESCYRRMFISCSNLTQAPVLPSTTLKKLCYSSMFQNCTSLITPPTLPATTLADSCYSSMFSYCSSLTTAPSLPATTLANECYRSMFYYCTNLILTPELPATTLADRCYQYMFQGCTNLTTAPNILPATTLTDYCYYYMFSHCSSLTNAPSLPATTLTNSCYSDMFYYCSSLTTAPSLPATTLVNSCYHSMFGGCTSLTTPAIMAGGTTKATTSGNYCCRWMYSGCTSLNIYTSSSGHTPFYKAISYTTGNEASYRMFINCYINGTQSTADYLTAGTQYYY